ncbi:MAG: major capsid protein, partial [Oscillospiraceae bacterium]|nr:major capsid protein [Oscillospiraceae bacterium]
MPYEFPRDAEFLEMLKKTNPPDEFLISRYCNRDKNIFKTKRVFWTYKNERERVAPTVAERKVSVALERDQWDAHECTIPYTGVHRPFTFDVTEDYGYGNAIASDLDFQTKCDRVLLDDARELRESIVRREVLMVASLMQNNAVTLQEVIDDKNAKTPWQIAFYDDGANPAQYTPPMPWTSSAADILADFDAIIDMRKEIHLPTSEFLVSPDVMSYIIRNTEIQN